MTMTSSWRTSPTTRRGGGWIEAWTDLLTSFEYHDANLRFAAKKFALDLGGRSIADLDRTAIDRLPAAPGVSCDVGVTNITSMQRALRAAEPGHVEDALAFAERAWRRPLTADEQERLRAFYAELRQQSSLDHTRAIRALLARILVAPTFLYRVEPPGDRQGIVPLSDRQLASRLSYFLWSSVPDRRTARRPPPRDACASPRQLERQARRMLRDPKARRLATEFFGQWLGFYRFDGYQGIDAKRFPEFTDRLKSSLYEESVSFFEHIVRDDRPVDEIVFADYSFWNRPLAEHYGITAENLADEAFVEVDGIAEHHRGGLLGLGAVLAVTSAPLRHQRRQARRLGAPPLVGTPVPPPPADVGFDPGRRRVRRSVDAAPAAGGCIAPKRRANCHSRIDPLGFALEHYDPIGRWRDTYRDGQTIEASGTLNDGTTVSGPEGLRDYLRREKTQFHRTISVKLLGYALGRSELASDRPLIDTMVRDAEQRGPLLGHGRAGRPEQAVSEPTRRLKHARRRPRATGEPIMTDRSSRSDGPISRRGFLRGSGGLASTLPWLESWPVRAAGLGQARTATVASTPPVRFACVYFSNGVEPAHWWAKGAGAAMEIGPGLKPMMPFREDMVFLKGLFNEQAARHRSPHLGRIPNLLSGAWVSTDQQEIRVGKTMDQVLAEHLGRQTAVPSLVLGIEPTELRLEDGLSMIYGSCISWASDTKPATKEIYPSRVFDLLIGDPDGRRVDRTILDEVLADAHDLARQVSVDDRKKLDEYLESVRDIEQRIERTSNGPRALRGPRPPSTTPDMPRPGEQLPLDIPVHMRLMMDLIVLAFQMDKTRVATLHAQQRPVANEFRVLERRARQLASRPHAQRTCAGTGSDVLADKSVSRRAIRLPARSDEENQ